MHEERLVLEFRNSSEPSALNVWRNSCLSYDLNTEGKSNTVVLHYLSSAVIQVGSKKGFSVQIIVTEGKYEIPS